MSSTELKGVTIFQHPNYTGDSQTFTEDIADMRLSRVGNDEASSLRVDPGCKVLLYARGDFLGEPMEVSGDLPSLDGMLVGNDDMSSLRVDCH